MAFGRPRTALELSDDERLQLSAMAKSRTLPHSLVARAKVVLWSVEGESNTQIAERLQWTKATVGKWRTDGADYVEEMLRIAVELSDADVRMLDVAQKEFDRQRAETAASENQIATISWLQARSGVTDSDERASIGAKLQSFGLVSRLQTNGPNPAYKVLRRGRRFLE